MQISFSTSGSFARVEAKLRRNRDAGIRSVLESCGAEGVRALSANTPQDTGTAARSWYYRVEKTAYGWELSWYNSDVESGFPVAVMIQYGHGTGTGGYIQGVDYINPAMRPIFKKIRDKAWKAVNSA